MSSSTNERGKDCVIVTTTALIHSPKDELRFFRHVEQNKEPAKTLITNKKLEKSEELKFKNKRQQNKKNTTILFTKETETLEELKSENKRPLKKRANKRTTKQKKQTIILKPLISTSSSGIKTAVKKPKLFTDSSINEKENEIFIRQLKRLSSSSASSFPDLEIEKEHKNKPKSKSSFSSIFSSIHNREKHPQTIKKESKKEDVENSKEEDYFAVRSPEPANQSIHSDIENILTVANKITDTPKCSKKRKKFIPMELCVTEKTQIELPPEIISKKKRLIKEEIQKNENLNSFNSFESHQTQSVINIELINNSSDFVPRSWERTGEPVPTERILRFMEMLRHYEKMVEEISNF